MYAIRSYYVAEDFAQRVTGLRQCFTIGAAEADDQQPRSGAVLELLQKHLVFEARVAREKCADVETDLQTHRENRGRDDRKQ